MYLINEIIAGNIFRKVIYYFCRSTEVINMTNIKITDNCFNFSII